MIFKHVWSSKSAPEYQVINHPRKRVWPHSLLAEQPEIIWANGENRRIQSTQNRFGITFTEVLIVVESGGSGGGGGGGGGNLILAIFENRRRLSLYRNNQSSMDKWS
jgi:hypothetical protein